MQRLAEMAILSHGWRRALLMFIAGNIAALSMPPLYFLVALFIAMPIWVWCLDGAEKRIGWQRFFGPSFSIGFFFGLGYFLLSLHWIGAAFFVDGGWILALMPFAIILLASLMAIFWGFASAIAHLFWSNSIWRILALTAALSGFEFLRGHIFSGFPFNLLGYSLTASEQISQISSLIGVYGLTAIIILLSSMLALVWPSDKKSLFKRSLPIIIIIASLSAQFAFGQYRINTTQIIERSDIKLRLVQPSIKQSEKWQADSKDKIMQHLISLSTTRLKESDEGINGITYLIWPEAAVPFYFSDYPNYLSQIANMLPLGKNLITGAPRKQFGQNEINKSYNSILMINSSGEIIDSYDKTHLVPFGEYLPFREFFKKFGLTQFVPGGEGWYRGKLRNPMSAPGAPSFLPLICYEAMFSAQLGKEINSADFILNLTNDAWFDNSIGPAQHFAQVKIRAIEEGKTLVRVANSGISALINPLGQVVASLDQGEVGILDVVPQKPLAQTFFSKYKNLPFFGFLGFLLIILLIQKIILRNKNY